MNSFVLTPAAKADLLKIIEYLEGDNPSAVLGNELIYRSGQIRGLLPWRQRL